MTQYSSKEVSSLDYEKRLQSAASSDLRIEIFEEVTATIAAGDPGACRAIILQARLSFSNPSKPVVEQRAAMRAYAAALKSSPESESVLPKDLNRLLEIEANSSYGDVKNEARQALLAILNASPVMVEEHYDQKRSQLDNVSHLENTKQLKTVVGILNEILAEFAFRDAAHITTEKPPAKSLNALGTLGDLLSAHPKQKTPQFLENIGHMTQNGLSKITQGRQLGIIPLLTNAAFPVAVAADLATLFPRIVASDIKRTYLGSDTVLTGVTNAAAVAALHGGLIGGALQGTRTFITIATQEMDPNKDLYYDRPPLNGLDFTIGGGLFIALPLAMSALVTHIVGCVHKGKFPLRGVLPKRETKIYSDEEIDNSCKFTIPLTRTVLLIRQSWEDKHNTPQI